MIALEGGAVIGGAWGRRNRKCQPAPTPWGRAQEPWLRGSLDPHPSRAVR